MSKLNFRLWVHSEGFHGKASVFLACALIFAAAAFFLPASVSADSGGYTTSAFDVNVVTDEDHVFHVSEEIQTDFTEHRHGIYRYIPDGEPYYSVRNVKVSGYTYEVYEESGNTVVQIGDPDYTVYGPQTYRISYDIIGYRDDDNKADFLSLDLLPTGWSTPIESADLRIEFPGKIDNIKTYVGRYGSGNMEGYFDVNSSGTVYTAVSTQTLPQGVGLTISARLPQGYWVDPYSRDDSLPMIYGILGVMGMLMLLLWLFVGRDRPIIPTVEFYPPEDLDPLELAYVGNGSVQAKDIPALFMYLADRGCLEITEHGKKRFSLVRIKEPAKKERLHTRQIFSRLFSLGTHVDLDDLPESFGEAAAALPSEVKESVEMRSQSFSRVSKAGRRIGLAFCFLIPLTAGAAYGWLTFGTVSMLLGLILSLIMFVSIRGLVGKTDAFRTRKRPVRITIAAIIFLGAALLEAYTFLPAYPVLAAVFLAAELAAAVATIFVRRRMNNELYGRVLGFREFIRTAEYDRLRMLSDEDPSYYFHILPYACVFGMSTKWADKFSDFRIPQPSWYHSYSGSWDPYFGHYVYFNTGSSIAGCVASHYRAIGADMLSSAVDSGGGGGFSGGGFSGGGFGGGGGGSW